MFFTRYVLPNHMMLQIAESLPREMQGILACCNPIPPLVRQNLHKLHSIILEARDQPLVKVKSLNICYVNLTVAGMKSSMRDGQDLEKEIKINILGLFMGLFSKRFLILFGLLILVGAELIILIICVWRTPERS
jgi:hypothetical protein